MKTLIQRYWLASTLLLCSLVAVAPRVYAESEDNWLAYGPSQQQDGQMGMQGPGAGGMNRRMRPGGGQMQGGGPGQMMSQLNLSKEQREKMQALMQKNRGAGKEGQQALMQKRQQLRTMMQSGSGSKEQAMALLGEINKLQSAQMSHRIGMMYEMKSILTPEQFQKFQSAMEQKRGQMKGQGVGGMRGGPNGGGFGGPGGGRMRGGFGGPSAQPESPNNDGF